MSLSSMPGRAAAPSGFAYLLAFGLAMARRSSLLLAGMRDVVAVERHLGRLRALFALGLTFHDCAAHTRMQRA